MKKNLFKTFLNFSIVFAILLSLLVPITVFAANAKGYEEGNGWINENSSALADYAYSIAVVGDTQTVVKKDLANGTEYLSDIYDWLVANADSKKIQSVLGLGDVVENDTNEEWVYAKSHITKLDGVIPYLLNRGNSPHDSVEQLNKYFALHSPYTQNLAGTIAEGNVANAYSIFTAGDTKYLVLALDFGPSDEELNWADEVITANPDCRVIITTHAYLYTDGSIQDANDSNAPNSSGANDGKNNNGDQMWNKLVKKHKNIALVLSGHNPSADIIYRQDIGDEGNIITSLLVNSQNFDAGRDGATGMVCMLYFANDGKTVSVEWISTVREQYYKAENQFAFSLTDAVTAVDTKYGTIPSAYGDSKKYPLAIFVKNGSSYKFNSATSTLPTSYNYGDDTVIYFRNDYAISNKKHDIDSIGAGNTLIFDLNGNTLDITGGNRYNALTSGSTVDGVTFTMKNGNVYSNGQTSLVCIQGNTGNKVSLNFENVDLTLGESFSETSALVRYSQHKDATVNTTYNITFTDCDIDVSAVNKSSLYVFRSGYSSSAGYDVNMKINGGSLNAGSSEFYTYNLCTQNGGKMMLGKGTNGKYLSVTLAADVSVNTAFADEDGKTRYLSAVKTDGTNYVYQPILLETEYGTIPAAYASVLKYPFVAFHNGSFVALDSGKSYDFFASTNLEVKLRSLDGAVVLMRADYTIADNGQYANLAHMNGTLTIDLMGNTLDASKAHKDGVFVNRGMNTFTTNLVVKNGKIELGTYLFSTTGRSGVEGKVQGFCFEDLEITSTATNLVRYATPESVVTVNIDFTDCSIMSSSLTGVFRAGFSATDKYVTSNLTVKGGSVKLDMFDQQSFITVYNGGNFELIPDDNGNMTNVYLAAGTAVSGTAYNGADGKALYLVEQYTDGSYDLYIPETLTTPYGDIPYSASSKVDFPFVAFKRNSDGSYTYVTANADFFKSGGMEYTLRSIADSVVLMRCDFYAASYQGNISNNTNIITLDLGGNTLTWGKSAGAFNLIAKHNTTSTLTIKNGTVLLDKYSFITYESNSAGAGKVFNLSLENLVFKYAEGATIKSPFAFNDAVKAFEINVAIVDCVFDLTDSAVNDVTLIVADDPSDKISVSVSVFGSEIIAENSENFAIVDNNANVIFKKNSDNELLVLNLPEDCATPDVKLTTEFGEMVFVKMSDVDDYAVYYLRDTSKFVTPKENITLYSDFLYNLNVPVKDSIISITLDGIKYTELQALTKVKINNVDYYQLTKNISVIDACETFVLAIEIEMFEGKTQNAVWTLGVVNYTEKLINSNYNVTVNTLANDILSYIRSAYIYNGAEEESYSAISAILGEDYDATSRPTDIDAVSKTNGLDGATLALSSSPSYMFYPETDEEGALVYSIDDYVFALDGKFALSFDVYNDENGRIYFLVKLPAYAIDNTIEYVINGTDIHGKYNIKAYYNFAENYGDDALISLVERLWKYAESAEAYKNSLV